MTHNKPQKSITSLCGEDDLLRVAMEKYKLAIAEKLGLRDKVQEQGWKSMTTSECGQIGGKMGTRLSTNLVRKIVEVGQDSGHHK